MDENNSKLQIAKRDYANAILNVQTQENWLRLLNIIGTFYGLPIEAQLAIYESNVNSKAIASKDDWEALGFTTLQNPIISLDHNETIKEYYCIEDIKPTESAIPITIWYSDEELNNIIAQFLGKTNDIRSSIKKYVNSLKIENKLLSNSLEDVISIRLGLKNCGHEYKFNGIPLSELTNLLSELNKKSKFVVSRLKKIAKDNKKTVIYTFDNGEANKYTEDVKTQKEDAEYDTDLPNETVGSVNLPNDFGGRGGVHSDRQLYGALASTVRNKKMEENPLAVSSGKQPGIRDRTSSGGQQRLSSEKGFRGESRENERGTSTPLESYYEERRHRHSPTDRLSEIYTRGLQRRSEGNGNVDTDNSLQLNLFKKTNTIQEAGLNNDPAFFVAELLVNECILHGTGFVDGKMRVYKFFLENNDTKLKADMLKEEYGWGGHSLHSDYSGMAQSDAKGLQLTLHDYEDEPLTLTWAEAATIIDFLIKRNEYLTAEEMEYYPEWIEKENLIQSKSILVEQISNLFEINDNTPSELRNEYYKFKRDVSNNFINSEFPGREVFDYLRARVNDNNAEYRDKAISLLSQLKDYTPEFFDESPILDYFEACNENPNHIVIINNGSYFEIMGSDAQMASELLGVSLEKKDVRTLELDSEQVDLVRIQENNLEESTKKLLNSGKSILVITSDENCINTFYKIEHSEKIVAVSEDNVVALTPDEILIDAEKAENKEIASVLTLTNELPALNKIKTNTHRNFITLNNIAPLLSNKHISYVRMEAGEGYMPLTIERIGGNEISVAHSYVEYGDLMYDPEIVFEYKLNEQELRPLSYTQHNMGIYKEVYKNGTPDRVLEAELSRFTSSWFENITNQGYIIEKAILVYNNDDITLYFNENGEIYKTEPENAAFLDELNLKLSAVPAHSDISKEEIFNDNNLTASSTEIHTEQTQQPSPLYREYTRIELENEGNLVLYQLGDFYEAMGDAAKVIASELDLVLTGRDVGFEERIPICGFPVKCLDRYLGSLTNKGYKVTVSTLKENSERVETTYTISDDKLSKAEEEIVKADKEKTKETPVSNQEPIIVEKEFEQSNDSSLKNYIISDNNIGIGTPLARFNNNIEAIKTLKAIEAEGRFATEEEQEVLAKYVGWGGLSEMFNPGNQHYNELAELLSEEEYKSARSSVNTAFYTPPIVIKAIYKALQRFGFNKGKLLEPSCGIGNFFGLLPEELSNINLTGIELDSLSSRIAKQLYPNADIKNMGFENTNYDNNSFDVAIGNVPFGDFRIYDKPYDKYHFMIHDYFFAKALDKVHPGGIVAFITSSGTLDKKSTATRKYIAKRAELIGAIRLPNNTFKGAAGTDVTSDIIFLKKRDKVIDVTPSWVEAVEYNSHYENVFINQYFKEHPEMVLGDFRVISGRYGNNLVCVQNTTSLDMALDNAVNHLNGSISYDYVSEKENKEESQKYVPLSDNAKRNSFIIHNNAVYYCEDYKMELIETNNTSYRLFEQLISIRDVCKQLIEAQSNGEPDEIIANIQAKLNTIYDNFAKNGHRICDRTCHKLFSDDASYPLVSSLENWDEGKFKSKADIFSERTIRPRKEITHVNSSNDALVNSLITKGKVDMPFMIELTGFSEDKILSDLSKVIFLLPNMNSKENIYVTADEYLSGNVVEKLNMANMCYKITKDERLAVNIEALSEVQPKFISAANINVRLGTTWIPEDIIDEFMREKFNMNSYLSYITVSYSDTLGEWNIENKSSGAYTLAARSTYGTQQVNGFKILEDCLNLKNTVVREKTIVDGEEKYVVNEKETRLAQGKQKLLRKEFLDWIWKDPDRRKRLEELYNNKFNSFVPRRYDGSHLTFEGMNTNITLREHQRNAIARILYGGNTLLNHCVGAGKTFEIVAAAMELKRMELAHKSMIVVPNNIVDQFASDWMKLYPGANILVTTEKNFAAKNRMNFCSKIATGNWDAVIIGHSQFEKIPLSKSVQIELLETQLDSIVSEIKNASGEKNRLTIKELERKKTQIKNRLTKLNDIEQDDIVTFEELGVDRLFVDEAHNYKNLFLYTNMTNVAGINTTESKKATDLYNKVRWLDKQTKGKGTIFATGTPISNTMAELYTMQRYLQADRLKQLGLSSFDAWASTFGETTSELELKPEGTGFRLKERFAKFYNVPELMKIFREIADIQTSEMLNLPTPNVHFESIVCTPSEDQKRMVEELGERADKIRNNQVDQDVDNMLLVTSDGRKLALEQRLIEPELPDFELSKVNACVNNVHKIWSDYADKKSTQLIFCDLSTPSPQNNQFNVYDDIKSKLIKKGIPEAEIAFVHDATTNRAKEQLFSKVRNGTIRVLLGSTQKCGTGTNVQDKLIAIHDLDCPWRPSDLEQRLGRIERQGNENKDVYCYRYVTEGTFDAYMYQLVEKKQKFISQIMKGDTNIREVEDFDEASLNYAKLKALAVGNPLIQEKMELELQVRDLLIQKQAFNEQLFKLQDDIRYSYPKVISQQKSYIENLKADIESINQHSTEQFVIIGEKVLYDRKDIGTATLMYRDTLIRNEDTVIQIGTHKGLPIKLKNNSFSHNIVACVGNAELECNLGFDALHNGSKLLAVIDNFNSTLDEAVIRLDILEKEFTNAKQEV